MQIYTPLGPSSYSSLSSVQPEREQKQLLVSSCLAILGCPSCSEEVHFAERMGGDAVPSARAPHHVVQSWGTAQSCTLPSQV